MKSLNKMPPSPRVCVRWAGRCLAVVLLAALLPAAASGTPVPGLPWDDPPPDLWFPVGEEIEYYIQWGVFTVGEAVARTAWTNHDGRRLLTITVEGQSNGIVEKLYPVAIYFQTVLDPATFLPLSFEKRSREGKRRYHELTTFDHEALTGYWRSFLREREEHFAIEPDTRDLIGLMYWIRREPVGENETRNYNVMTDEKMYELIIEAGRRERVSLGNYGRVACIKMEPKGKFDGMFVRKGRMFLWVSDDPRYVITRVTASVPVASIKIMLREVRGPGDDFWVGGGS